MNFANEIYLGKIAKISEDHIIEDLAAGIYREGFFLVALSPHDGALLEAIPAETFNDEVYLKYHDINKLNVVGLAVTKREAVELMQEIVLDVFRKTKGFRVKEFFTFS